jgi:hypothetical protein
MLSWLTRNSIGLFFSRSMNISYLQMVPIDTTVRVHSRIVSVNKTMMYIEAKMTSVDGLTVFSTAQHHLHSMPATGEKKEESEKMLKWSLEEAKRKLRSTAKF